MAVIQLIAPSGFCTDPQAAQRGIARLQQSGHQVRGSEIIARRFQRFAGTDAERLAELNGLADLSDDVDIVLAVRGGYGASRLLPDIDYQGIKERLERRPVALCGHSDFSAIQLALLAQSGVVSFSSPMLAGNFGASTLNQFTWHHFWQALTHSHFCLSFSSSSPAFQVQGMLWGGNLTLLCALIGTPWFPDIKGGILVIEDINEHPFRVERMLLQLHYTGILAKQRAIIFGSFSQGRLSDYDGGFNLTEVQERLKQHLAIPVIAGLSFGHEAETVTLPLGAQAQLTHDGVTATLNIEAPRFNTHM